MPVLSPTVNLPDTPSINLGEPNTYLASIEGSINSISFLYGSSVMVQDVYLPQCSLLWKDIVIKIVSDGGTVLVNGLRPLPIGIPGAVNDVEGQNTITARYENDIIMHGHVYPGDTLYLSNLTHEFNDAVVKLVLEGRVIGAFALEFPFHWCLCPNWDSHYWIIL
jgi:hypothetical protein